VVNIIDLKTDKAVGSIDSLNGVHGIAIVNEINKGFISDGRANTVVVFDLKTLKTLVTINISGKNPDAILFDPFSKKVFVFNAASDNASVIDISSLAEVETIDLGGAPEFAISDNKGKIYNNLEDKNSIIVIDSRMLKIIRNYPLAPCGGPTGLAFDKKRQRLFIVCRQNKGMTVLDSRSGKVITTLPIGAGVDGVAYDPSTRLIFCSCGDGTVTIIKQESADKYMVVQNLPTQVRARTITLDPATHKIYLSVARFEEGTRKPIPGSFEVLVFKMN
jgi:YVTN family beta-propeller protein